jgi:hypothetical protein
MTDLVDVPGTIVHQAYRNFRDHYYHGQDGVGMKLWFFLKKTSDYPMFSSTGMFWSFPPEQARLIHLLAGPYFKTIAKMMEMNGHSPHGDYDGTGNA